MNEKILLPFLFSIFITTPAIHAGEKTTQTDVYQSENSVQTDLSFQQLAAQLNEGEKITALPLVLAIDSSGHVRIIDPDKFIPQPGQPANYSPMQLPETDYDLFKEALVLCIDSVGKGTTGALILTWLGGKVVFKTTVKASVITWDFLKYLVNDVIVPKITAANTPDGDDNAIDG